MAFRRNLYSSFRHFANTSQRVADQGRAGGKIISTSEFACQGFLVAHSRYLICDLLEIFQFSSVQGISFVSSIRYLSIFKVSSKQFICFLASFVANFDKKKVDKE